MAPEQARDSRKTSERSDIYSLGCTFYYLLTGSQPFPGGNLADKLSRHHSAPPPDARERRPEIPEAVAKLVQKMMAKKPEQRFADYSHLIDGLDRLLGLPPAAMLLDALIVDDEDDDDLPIPLDLPPAQPVLMAEIVDEMMRTRKTIGRPPRDSPRPGRPGSLRRPPRSRSPNWPSSTRSRRPGSSARPPLPASRPSPP